MVYNKNKWLIVDKDGDKFKVLGTKNFVQNLDLPTGGEQILVTKPLPPHSKMMALSLIEIQSKIRKVMGNIK